MELFLFKFTLGDFLRSRRLVVWILVIFAIYGIAVGWRSLTVGMSVDAAYGQMSSVLVFHVVALVAAIFSTAVIGQEVEQKTIVYLLTRPVPRWKIVTIRALVAIVVVFAISALTAVAVSLGVFGPGGLSNRYLWSDWKVLLIGSAAYCSLFVFVSLIVNRAMIICLLFAFGWETAVPNMPGDLSFLSIYSYLSAMANHPATSEVRGPMSVLSGALSTGGPSEATGYPVLILLTLAMLACGALWFSHFEYLPREDAE